MNGLAFRHARHVLSSSVLVVAVICVRLFPHLGSTACASSSSRPGQVDGHVPTAVVANHPVTLFWQHGLCQLAQSLFVGTATAAACSVLGT
jgi:hypothetical protein